MYKLTNAQERNKEKVFCFLLKSFKYELKNHKRKAYQLDE